MVPSWRCHATQGGSRVSTRIPVGIVLDSLADGMTPEQIIDEHASLSTGAVRASAAYGAELAREEPLLLSGYVDR